MKKITLLSCTMILAFGLCAQEISSAYIDSLVEHSMDQMTQAGMAIGVIVGGELVHAKGYGCNAEETGEKTDENSLFCIASNSKAFTTTALGILVDRGLLDWNDKVVDYIPEFKMYDPYVTREFTIVDLLTHRSGLGLGAGDLLLIPDGNDFTMEDILNSFQHQTPVSSFRTKYDYDNLLYLVAGEVLYRVTGTPWDEFVEREIMKPLGMDRSAGLFQNLDTDKNIARPHRVEDGELIQFGEYARDNGGFGAAGGIYSSVNDLSKWVMMHLNEGKYGDSLEHELISHANHDMLWTAHTNTYFDATPSGPYQTHYRAYGLGFNLYDQMGTTIVQHSGGLPGMLSMVTMIPEKNAAIIVLTNSAPGGYGFVTMTNAIKDKLIGAPERDWIGLIKNYLENNNSNADSVVNEVWETVTENSKNPIDVTGYIGSYEDAWFGKVNVELRGTELWLSSVRSPKLSGRMYYYQANTFAIKWNYQDMECDAFASFNLDKEGVAQEISMQWISPDTDFSFDFHDLDFKRVEKP